MVILECVRILALLIGELTVTIRAPTGGCKALVAVSGRASPKDAMDTYGNKYVS